MISHAFSDLPIESTKGVMIYSSAVLLNIHQVLLNTWGNPSWCWGVIPHANLCWCRVSAEVIQTVCQSGTTTLRVIQFCFLWNHILASGTEPDLRRKEVLIYQSHFPLYPSWITALQKITGKWCICEKCAWGITRNNKYFEIYVLHLLVKCFWNH